MNKIFKIIHCILFSLSILILASSLILYLTKSNSLSAEIGMHFDGNGEFDVVASKLYGFYPHIVSGIFIIITAFADYFVTRKKTGLKLTEQGEKIFRTEMIISLDFFALFWSVFFGIWSYSVSLQIPLNIDLLVIIWKIFLAVIFVTNLCGTVMRRKHKIRTARKEKNPQAFHRISRIIAYILTAGEAFMLFWCWDRYPADDELYFNEDYYGLAYFANFDKYLDKHYLLIPQIMIFVILATIEIISVKAVKSDKKALVSLTDRLRLTVGVFFFWWNLMLDSCMRIGIFSVSLFLILNIIYFVLYFRFK
ncbi:MAG: hypothetical protein IJ666_00375 [Ruminococcus sp.]|nr:hypothetical protein [Ruminococcus sp.]